MPVVLPPNDVANLLFAPVNVVAALVWGYGIRSMRLGRGPVGFFVVAVVVGVVTGVVATPIVLFVFGGSTGHPSDLITAALASFGLERAALVSNMLASVPDKVISAYLGLAITAALPMAVVAKAQLPGSPARAGWSSPLRVMASAVVSFPDRLMKSNASLPGVRRCFLSRSTPRPARKGSSPWKTSTGGSESSVRAFWNCANVILRSCSLSGAGHAGTRGRRRVASPPGLPSLHRLGEDVLRELLECVIPRLLLGREVAPLAHL